MRWEEKEREREREREKGQRGIDRCEYFPGGFLFEN